MGRSNLCKLGSKGKGYHLTYLSGRQGHHSTLLSVMSLTWDTPLPKARTPFQLSRSPACPRDAVVVLVPMPTSGWPQPVLWGAHLLDEPSSPLDKKTGEPCYHLQLCSLHWAVGEKALKLKKFLASESQKGIYYFLRFNCMCLIHKSIVDFSS